MSVTKKVVVAMSGGVDSSVVAAILANQGYDVTGMMLRLWSEEGENRANRCCTPDSMRLARSVAAQFGIPFYAIDIKERFHDIVVQPFIDAYVKGVTPNPCLFCNRSIRWGLLMTYAREFGADFMATGHYAKLTEGENGEMQLWKGVDPGKDQSYVLSVLSQDQLAHSLFPLGSYYKTEVREIARKYNLPVSDRPDSQDLCFLSDGDYRRFLSVNAKGKISPGPIANLEGEILGTHDGLAYYTIGQRKGIRIPSKDALYVIDKNVVGNILIVGTKEQLGRDALEASDVHWISNQKPIFPFHADVKIRYKAKEASGMIIPLPGDKFRVEFDYPIRDISPGQVAVIYQGEQCLGSGIID